MRVCVVWQRQRNGLAMRSDSGQPLEGYQHCMWTRVRQRQWQRTTAYINSSNGVADNRLSTNSGRAIALAWNLCVVVEWAAALLYKWGAKLFSKRVTALLFQRETAVSI